MEHEGGIRKVTEGTERRRWWPRRSARREAAGVAEELREEGSRERAASQPEQRA
jgi:hypothetical protein